MQRFCFSNPHRQAFTLLWLGVLMAAIPLFAAYANGFNYTQGIETSSWRFEGSVFECSIVHTMPFYGDAVFTARAGETATFALQAKTSRLKTGKALLRMEPPKWRHNLQRIDLGYVGVRQGLEPVHLGARYAERILTELNTGYEMQLTRMPWYGAEASSHIHVSPIGFKEVYQRYLGCLSDLLPVNFDQIRRTAIYFGMGTFEPLSQSQKTQLDHIVTYYQADPSITEFYIDGHTDSIDTRANNYTLAENRAKEVRAYLVSQGLPEDQMVVRWHGERYPAASNHTKQGRAKNRRVTIRLERSATPPAGATAK
ncbi:flagellar protein MotY [Marinagarivorans algicola]|uniref:flagellar protein MotY n=1 Tax=Marinagarivorans algicola TaxID=1513270 RepID=UPI00373610A4